MPPTNFARTVAATWGLALTLFPYRFPVRAEGKNAIANIVGSYLRWNLRIVFRDRCTVFPERFARPCPGRKVVCSIDADHGCRRCVPRNREAPNKQHRRRNHNLLLDRNGVADREAQGGGNEPYGLGCAAD